MIPVLVPRFRSSSYIAAPSDTNFGNKGALAGIWFLVPLIDLKFLNELAAGDAGTSNSAALAPRSETAHWAFYFINERGPIRVGRDVHVVKRIIIHARPPVCKPRQIALDHFARRIADEI